MTQIEFTDVPMLGRVQIWTAVCAANMVLPGVFVGFGATGDGGRVGFGLAIIVIWLLGAWMCSWPNFGAVVCRGGAVMAVLQVFPAFHLAAGVCSIGLVWSIPSLRIESSPYRGGVYHINLTDLGRFLATILGAAFLFVPSFLFGGGHRLLFAPPSGPEIEDYQDTVDRIAEGVP